MILQFAKLPPPIGGVSVHTKRLLESLKNKNIEVSILDYSKERSVIEYFNRINKCNIIHIHLSRKFVRFIFVLFFKLLKKKIIITFHGKYDFENFYDRSVLKISDHSFLLNINSYKKALLYNNNISLSQAFIPPQLNSIISIKDKTQNDIKKLKECYKYVFCTNAWNVAFDENGGEIYNGTLLMEIFDKNNDIALVFSDPASNYEQYLKSKFEKLPKNVYFITYPHDFTDVIKLTNASIRATTTDGDSLSVKESLYFKKDVITSDVVDRPDGCIIYSNPAELSSILLNFETYKNTFTKYKYIGNTVSNHIEVYKMLLNA